MSLSIALKVSILSQQLLAALLRRIDEILRLQIGFDYEIKDSLGIYYFVSLTCGPTIEQVLEWDGMTSSNLYFLTRKDLSHPAGNWKRFQVRTSEAQSTCGPCGLMPCTLYTQLYLLLPPDHRYASFTGLTQGELKLDSWSTNLVTILAMVIGTVLVQT